MKRVSFCCPVCRGLISYSDNCLVCRSCQVEFPLLDHGIPDFSIDRGFYYGSLTQETMQSLLQQMDDVGWRRAIKQIGKTLPTRKQRSLVEKLREDRAAWKYLLDISDDKRVLDYGCGMGSISIALARNFGEVVCFDLATERLMFLKKWSEQLGLKNMVFVKGGDAPFLPFPEQYFDAVVLNGVLEWIPESRRGDPKQAQLDCLREVHRVLTIDGECYIGIENRFSYRYFLGKREDHTRLRFSSLVPRFIANLYSLAVRRKPYRTYTYSLWGYRHLLRKAGFRNLRSFLPYPIYRRFSQIVNMYSERRMDARLMAGQGGYRRAVYFFDNQLLKWFAPSFSIIASKRRSASQSFLEQLVSHIVQKVNHRDDAARFARIKYVLVSSGKVSVVVDSGAGSDRSDGKSIIIKIPLTPYSDQRLERNATALEAIRNNKAIAKALAKYTSRSIVVGNFVGQRYFAEELMPGVCAESLRLCLSDKIRLMRSALDILTEFHAANLTSSIVDESILEKLFIKPIIEVGDFLEYENEDRSLNRITSALRELVLGRRLPLVWSHGDYSLKNIIVNKSTLQISGLIDWDLASQNGLPLTDLLHLLVRLRMMDDRMGLSEVFCKHILPLKLKGMERDMLSEYVEALSVEPELMKPLSIMYWISRIHGHIGSLNDLDSAWVNKNFTEVVEDVSRNL